MPITPIQYLKRDQVNTVRWDQHIDNAANGLVYAYSFYLDHMARNWDALVMGDYDIVMPLTWNKKYGIYYLYQPPFTAALGVFGNALNEETIRQFLAAVPSKFRLIEISLNHKNHLSSFSESFSIRNNYILDMSASYDQLYAGYRENTRRNIKKSQQLGARYETDVPVAAIIGLSKEQMQTVWALREVDYVHFEQLYNVLRKRNQAIACGIYLRDELVASAVYFFSHNRAYYILVGNHPNGKTIGASHYLIDRFIYDHAGKDLILDFEGSDIRNLAFFYSSFGATLETYPAIRINNLPWWVNLLRK
jgi:hypothetical protein